jgi:hypothetical protein
VENPVENSLLAALNCDGIAPFLSLPSLGAIGFYETVSYILSIRYRIMPIWRGFQNRYFGSENCRMAMD